MAEVNLRVVEWNNLTAIFEGQVPDVVPGDVEPLGGPITFCDGTNYNVNTSPGPACTNALQQATAEIGRWNGVYSAEQEDYLVTGIMGVQAGVGMVWRLLLNFQYAAVGPGGVGGCRLKINNGDNVLWALIPQGVPPPIPLKLEGPRTAPINTDVNVSVINGSDRSAAGQARVRAVNGGVVVADVMANGNGIAALNIAVAGEYTVRATRADGIPSNALALVVG